MTNSSFIQNPNATFFPISNSVEAWNIPGIEGKPEYAAWTGGVPFAPALTYEQVTNITSSSYNYFGLNNTYNLKVLEIADTTKSA